MGLMAPKPVTTTRLHAVASWRQAAVHRQHLPRDVGRLVAQQEAHRGGHLLAGADAPGGIIFSASARTRSSTISVSISPGATQFTVMARLASSTASARVAPMIPALEAL